MLANRGSQGGAPTQMNYAPQGGGGLGDLLGQVLGGAAGGRGGAGGLGGLLAQMQQAGFGEQADSWVSRGANQPISPDAMTQIFGRDGIEEISRRAGVSHEDAARGLSQLLPEVVDHVTPDGDVPDDNALGNSVDQFVRRLELG
ncbi:MAG: YidB family protein [Candidatus Rokuibacteriota bacterium]